MRHCITTAVVSLVLACSGARGDTPLTAIDLSSFNDIQPATAAAEAPFHDAGLFSPSSDRRLYITGMIGPSFAAVGSPATDDLDTSDTIFTAGGALGTAIQRQRGQLRLEVEGLGRNTYVGAYGLAPSDSTILLDNWSVTANAWRDVMVTDRLGLYGGGGIGGGGYTLAESFQGDLSSYGPAGGLAWRAGGGLFWEITDRLTVDLGYRYFQIDVLHQENVALPNQFAASELMVGLRLYEPFRRWRD